MIQPMVNSMSNQEILNSEECGGPIAAGHLIDAKHEPHRVYKIIDKDNKLIETTAREVAEASKLNHNFDLWYANFQATIARVHKWCVEHTDQLRLALVDIRSNKVLFYFVPHSDHYNLALGDRMTDLEIELEGSAGIGYVESLQVPFGSLMRFAGPRSLIIWYHSTADLQAVSGPKD